MAKRYGWVISNGALKSLKYMEIVEMYQEAATNIGIKLELFFNNEILFGIENNILFLRESRIMTLPDFILFLDKDIRLAHQLEQMGIRIFNPPKVIEICDDKSKTFQALANKGIRMPKTIIAPLVFEGMVETSMDYIDYIENELDYPIVIKESYGSFGEQVYLVKNREELISKRKKLLYVPHIYQSFIKSSKGIDVRINIVGDHMVASMLRRSETDFRANVTNGGVMQNYQPSKEFEELAIKACQLLGADFAGVDLLFGQDGEPVICEINSNAHIKNIQTCSGINVAEHILSYILRELNL